MRKLKVYYIECFIYYAIIHSEHSLLCFYCVTSVNITFFKNFLTVLPYPQDIFYSIRNYQKIGHKLLGRTNPNARFLIQNLLMSEGGWYRLHNKNDFVFV